MKAKDSISVLQGDTVWINDYNNKPKEGGFVCEVASSDIVYKGIKGNVAFCVTYRTKSGRIKTKWVNRARVTAGARIVLTEKNVPIKRLDAHLMSIVQNQLGMGSGFIDEV